MPIFTNWVSPDDRLGQILVETGQLTAAERDRAVLAVAQPVAGATHERLGHYLIRRRLLLTAQLRKTLHIQCARKLVHCFALRAGEAHVSADATAPAEDQTLGAQVNTLELIFAGVSACRFDLPRIAAEMGPLLKAPLRLRSSLERLRGGLTLSQAGRGAARRLRPERDRGRGRHPHPAKPRPRRADRLHPVGLPDAQGRRPQRVTSRRAPTRCPRSLAGPGRKVSIGAGATDPARLADFATQLERLEAAMAAGAHAFELMGVPIDAGRPQVRAAWHTLSRRFRPDALARHELGHLRERSATACSPA